MDAKDLRLFEAVARLGGMNKAAREQNTVQSNVTARIRALELELGVRLFRRHGRGVELTKAGGRLAPYARKVAWVLAEARRAALDEGEPSGVLQIGSLETTAASRLPPLVAKFGMNFPAVDLNLKVATNDELVRRVRDFELDGAFVCAPVKHSDLLSVRAFTEELVIASGPGFAGDLSALRSGCKLLVKGPGCAYRDRLERLVADQGVHEVTRLEFGTLDAILGCVEAGLGVTLLPRSVIEQTAGAKRIRIHRLPGEVANVETLFVRRRDALEFSALRVFIAYVVGGTESQPIMRKGANAAALC